MRGKFAVTTCSDGNTAQELLVTLRPDVLVLDLMLPQKDGITILEDAAPWVPPVVLATTRYFSPYIEQSAPSAGIGYIIMTPCPARTLFVRLMDMIRRADLTALDAQKCQEETARALLRLGIPSQMDGFRQLRFGIPLYAQDPFQKLTKELYPAIAGHCGNGTGESVERSIRSAIKAAWKAMDPGVWGVYFPADADGII